MKKILFSKEKNKNSYYMIIKTGNEYKIELKEGLNEENKKKQKSIKKINEENREEVLILKFKLKKIMKQY